MNIDEGDESARDASVITIVTTTTTIIINIVVIIIINNNIVVNIQLTITYLVLDVQVCTFLCQSYSDVLVTIKRGQC